MITFWNVQIQLMKMMNTMSSYFVFDSFCLCNLGCMVKFHFNHSHNHLLIQPIPQIIQRKVKQIKSPTESNEMSMDELASQIAKLDDDEVF